MAPKRPSDRKAASITVRLTRTERARLRVISRPDDSLSQTFRRMIGEAFVRHQQAEGLGCCEACAKWVDADTLRPTADDCDLCPSCVKQYEDEEAAEAKP